MLSRTLGDTHNGLKFVIAHVLPKFKDLMEDSEPDVRANCALVLPRMIHLAGPLFSNLIFDDLFFAVLHEKNPNVLEKFLKEVHLAVRVMAKDADGTEFNEMAKKVKSQFKQKFIERWRRLLPICSTSWRCCQVYLDQTRRNIRILRPFIKTLFPKLAKLLQSA